MRKKSDNSTQHLRSTVSPWITWVWAAQVHLVWLFFSSKYYRTIVHEWGDEVQTQQPWKEKSQQTLRCDALRQVHCVKCTVTLFFLDTSEAFPSYKFKGLCGVFCHSKNSKEQEATGRLQKRLYHSPLHGHPVRWAGFCPQFHLALLFLCSQRAAGCQL